MAKKRLFDLPQTKAEFQICGNAFGVLNPKFYTTKQTKNNSTFRMVYFGVTFDKNSNVNITLNGTPRESVYYYSSADKKTVPVAWKDREKVPGKGYNLIGVRLGLEKIKDENGNLINDKKTMTEYDAAEYVSQHMKDGMSLFIKGALEFNSYTDNNGAMKKNQKFIPNQISLCSKPVDMESEDFKPLAAWKATIVFERIDREKDENGKNTGRFVVDALMIGYDNIENISFIVEDNDFAKDLRDMVKPYSSIEVTGEIKCHMPTTTVKSNKLGKASVYDRVDGKMVTELILTGADLDTVDVGTYTEDKIVDARRAIANKDKVQENFGEKKNDSSKIGTDGWDNEAADNNDDDDNIW